VAGDQLAPGPEVLDASSSRVLREEGKVGVWFPGSDDGGVLGKGGDGESRAEQSGVVRWPSQEEEGRRLPRSDSVMGDARGGGCMHGTWSGRVGWPATPAHVRLATGRRLSGH
jgi:hypothetical protein